MVSERRTSATGAFVMAGVAIGAETSSSWAIAMIVIFFNCHEEWLWWSSRSDTIRVFWWGGKEETGRCGGRIYWEGSWRIESTHQSNYEHTPLETSSSSVGSTHRCGGDGMAVRVPVEYLH